MAQVQHIEPGVIPTFRRFVIVIWLLLCLGMCNVSEQPNGIPQYSLIFNWINTSVLLIYLSLSRLRSLMGGVYLPVALLLASVVPLFTHAVTTGLNVAHGLYGDAALVDGGVLYIWLILPLLIISLQYTTRTMFLFTIGTSLLSVLVMIPVTRAGGPALSYAWNEAFVRLLLFSVTGYVVVRISQAQREQRKALSLKNQELANYATTMEQLAISRERNRMARELHDTLAHTLSAVNIQLKALEVLLSSDQDAAREMLVKTQQLTRDGLHEARQALQSLRSNQLEEMGIGLALRQVAESAANRAGLGLTLELPAQINGISPVVEQNLYRIASEAITNVVRHAQATMLSVSLQQRKGIIYLVVEDNGTGFKEVDAKSNGHYGIITMQERAMLCNGKLSIKSVPQQGTCVMLTIGAEE